MNKKLRNYAIMAMLVALAVVVMAFRIPIAFLPSFYKFDFSDVVIILGACAIGPGSSIAMSALKVIIKMLTQGSNSAFVGDLANFIMSVAFIWPIAYYYWKKPSFKQLIIASAIGIISLTIVGCIVNYFVLLPMYAQMYKMDIPAIVAIGSALNPNIKDLFGFVLLATTPFNLIKGTANAAAVLLIYKTAHVLFKNKKQSETTEL